MRFRTYIMLSAASLWFVIGSMFLYRYTWKLDRSMHHKGALIEYGVKLVDAEEQEQGFAFKISGLDQQFGVHFKNKSRYQDLTDNLQIGDSIDLYYTEWRLPKGAINLQIVHMATPKKVFVDIQDRKRRDLTIGLLLYFFAAVFGTLAWYLNRLRARN